MSSSTSSRVERHWRRAPGTLSVPLGSEPGGRTHGVEGITRSNTAALKRRRRALKYQRTVFGASVPPPTWPEGLSASARTQISTCWGCTSGIGMRPRSVPFRWRRRKISSLNFDSVVSAPYQRSPNSSTVGTSGAGAGAAGARGLGASGSQSPSS